MEEHFLLKWKIAWYLSAPLLSLVVIFIVFQLWNADLRIPIFGGGDSNLFFGGVKTIIEEGWTVNSPRLGGILGQTVIDFPSSASANLLIIRIIALFSSNYAVVSNLYVILGFAFTAFTTMILFKYLNCNYWLSLAGSILYSFVPYHFTRLIPGHAELASYYCVPLALIIALRIISKDYPRRRIEKIQLIVCCVFISVSGIYYAFFSVGIMAAALLINIINTKTIKKNFYAFLSMGLITLGVVVSVLPSIIYSKLHGANLLLAHRGTNEAEYYGLKILNLMLPIANHRITVISDLVSKYYNQAPFVYENAHVALGLIGTLGFLTLLLSLLFYKQKYIPDRIRELGMLNIVCLLVGTMGGFGVVFAYLVSPQIRAYNRISIYIALISIAGAICLIDFLFKKANKRILIIVVSLLLIVVGVYDQTSATYVPNYENYKREFTIYDNFVKNIEAAIPEKSLIFQLPYIPFPENPPINKMQDYDLMEGYLHSNTLRWSYGAAKGRYSDAWIQSVSAKPTAEMISTLSYAGYNGLYIDTFGYMPEDLTKLQTELAAIFNEVPVVSENQRLLFYSMTSYNAAQKAGLTAEEWKTKSNEALAVPILYSSGFYSMEGNPENSWRWCSNKGTIRIYNSTNTEYTIQLSFTVSTGYEANSNFTTSSDGKQKTYQINAGGTAISEVMTLKPGENAIDFTTDAPQVAAPADSRTLYMNFANFEYVYN